MIAFERHKYLKRKIFSLVYHGVSYKTAKALAERLADGIFDDETKRLEEKAVEEERHSIDWLLI